MRQTHRNRLTAPAGSRPAGRLAARAAALLAALLLWSVPAVAESSAQPQGLVSFTFDDASMSQYRFGLAIAKANGIAGTIFVPTELVRGSPDGSGDDWFMTWDDLKEFQDAGWEIGAHGQTHTRLTQLAPDEVEAELMGAMADIEQHIGIKPVSFSSPFGAFNDETIARIMKHYRYHVSWKGHDGRNPEGHVEPRHISRVEVTSATSSDEVCGEMVRAAQTQTWLVLLFHEIVADGPDEYQVSAGLFEEVVSCARLLQKKGVIRVKTVRDAMQTLDPPESGAIAHGN